MRVLALALGVPFPPVGGGLTRTFQLLRALSSRHDVVLAGFTYGGPHETPPYPIRVERVPWQWSRDWLDMTGDDAEASAAAYQRLAWDTDEPWFSSALDPGPMESALRQLLEERVDLILLEGTPLAKFLPVLPRDVPRVLDLFDVHTLMLRRELEQASGDRDAVAREAERTQRWERAAVRQCCACLTVSDSEAAAARELLEAGTVHVVPNGVDAAYFTPSPARPRRGSILFSGRMSYEPNAKAACYFATEILPLVRQQIPHARFDIVGAAPLPSVTALAGDSVAVHSAVADMRPYYWNADVVVVPMLTGGGTRLKVLEAAASGKAIVSTPLGVEGIEMQPGRDLLVADTPADFASAVASLIEDPARRLDLGLRARAVACRYDWSLVGTGFRRILEECVSA